MKLNVPHIRAKFTAEIIYFLRVIWESHSMTIPHTIHLFSKSKAIVLSHQLHEVHILSKVREQSFTAIAGDFGSGEWSSNSSEEFCWSDLQMSRWMIHTSDEVFQPIESMGGFVPTFSLLARVFQIYTTKANIHMQHRCDGWIHECRQGMSIDVCEISRVIKFTFLVDKMRLDTHL